MIPRETKCKYCGKSILWVMTAEGKRIPIESRFTPFKRRTDGGAAPALWTNEGVRIPCVPLSEEREAEAEGYAHQFHFCPARPKPFRRAPMTRKSLREAEG